MLKELRDIFRKSEIEEELKDKALKKAVRHYQEMRINELISDNKQLTEDKKVLQQIALSELSKSEDMSEEIDQLYQEIEQIKRCL